MVETTDYNRVLNQTGLTNCPDRKGRIPDQITAHNPVSTAPPEEDYTLELLCEVRWPAGLGIASQRDSDINDSLV